MRCLLLALLGCGASQPSASTSSDEPSDEPREQTEAPSAENPCGSPLDCEILYDNCGGPSPQRIGEHTTIPRIESCPPARYEPTEPACRNGLCVAGRVYLAPFRECGANDDCVIVPGVCDEPFAIAKARREEAEREIVQQGMVIDCLRYDGPRDLRAECSGGYCITRLP